MAEVVGEMDKGRNEKIIFSLSEFRGKSYADVRVYYEDDEGEFKPTKKGVTVGLDEFPQFKENILELESYLVEKGFIPKP
jgi:hypothetical protein